MSDKPNNDPFSVWLAFASFRDDKIMDVPVVLRTNTVRQLYERCQDQQKRIKAADTLLESAGHVLSVPWDDDMEELMRDLEECAKRYEALRREKGVAAQI